MHSKTSQKKRTFLKRIWGIWGHLWLGGVKVVSTLTPNVFFHKKSTEVLDGMQSRRVYTVNYKGEFQKVGL